MNLKSIQRNYTQLTMLERLSLADNAVARNDESEIRAIIAASPRVSSSQPDYLDLFESINRFRFCNLITRLSYIMQFSLFCLVDEDGEGLSDNARLAAYLYIRATDSWRIICDEFGLRPDFSDLISNNLLSVEMLEMKDKLLRKLAFTESEAEDFLTKQCGVSKLQTLADETKAIREALGLTLK